jgi:uncharacterized damage-inducible protein DinB
MAMSDMLLPEFDIEMANTRKVLERVPEDRLDWRPHQKSFTMGEMASHLVNMAGWMIYTLTTDSLDVMPDGEPMRMPGFATVAAMLEAFDINTVQARATLVATSDEQFMQPWTLLGNGNAFFTMPRIAVLRSMVFNHLIHHRGQLTVYLRINDVPLPAIYGPTADEEMM